MKRILYILVLIPLVPICNASNKIAIDKQDCQIIKGDKTFPLYGDVKIVESGEDFRVELVEYGADLEVKIVDYSADKCGEIHLVEYSADAKVRVVENNGDIKVKIVKYSPGLTK